MKIALVHELLTMRGGAEKVLRVLAAMFPDAPIFTLLYNEQKLGDWFPKERVRTSHLQNHLQFAICNLQFLYNHHLYLRQFPKAVESFDFSDFDLVISTSSAFVHGIITNGKPRHLCYVNAPARYLWDRTHDVLERAGKGFLGPLKRAYLEHTFHRLRLWDAEVAPRPDMLLAASASVQRRIELYWRRESTVLYPPLEDFWLQSSTATGVREPQLRKQSADSSKLKTQSSYLIVSQLVPYKRIDLAIEACTALKRRLVIVGDGPDRRRLERLAGPTIAFRGYVPAEELRTLYTSARAFLFPGDEDFGLAPLEAQACGTPVIAYRSGGALETTRENATGIFFDAATPHSLAEAIVRFEAMHFDAGLCRSNAERFSRERFEEGIRDAIGKLRR